MAASDAPGRREFPGIQYLRGIAALLVVLFHVSMQRLAYGAVTTADTLQSGVDIFFVISGFVMVYSTGGGRSASAGDFIRRRLIRIVPLYWALTLFMVAVLILAPRLIQTSRLTWPHMLASLLFLPAHNPATVDSIIPLVTPGWTLNLEMFFYALFAIAIAISRGRPAWLLAGVTIPLAALAAMHLVMAPKGALGFYANPITLEFLYGVALGLALLTRQPRIGLWPGVAAMILLFALLLLPPQGDILLRPFRYGLIALAIVWLATAMPLPRMALLHRLGDSSYSLYLSHFFVLSAFSQIWRRAHFEALPAAAPLFYLCATGGALLTGILCWRWIEVPLTRVTQRAFGKRRDPLPVSVRV